VTDRGTDRGTDRQTGGRTGVSKERAIAYMLSRAKNCNTQYSNCSNTAMQCMGN